MSTATRTRRTAQEWDTFAKEIRPELQAGKRLSDPEIAERIGANVDAMRAALARQGWDSHGDEIRLKAVEAKTPKVLAKRVAARRKEGAPWWMLQAETNRSYGELRRLLTEHGYWSEVSGRQQRPNGKS